jgi:hypothetical protein
MARKIMFVGSLYWVADDEARLGAYRMDCQEWDAHNKVIRTGYLTTGNVIHWNDGTLEHFKK